MGYGGLGLMRHTGKTGDGGVDGVIEEDKLGLNRIYVRAKRYGAGSTVGSEEMRSFLGAMSGKVDRGVFLTTSTFTLAAVRELDGRGAPGRADQRRGARRSDDRPRPRRRGGQGRHDQPDL